MLYQDINAIVAKPDGGFSAAESHGMATGMLCVNERTEIEFWLGEIQQGMGEFDLDDRKVLENLFDDTRNCLTSDQFTYDLLLPVESTPFDEQVEALRNWCQGFLYGIGSASPLLNWPEDVREVVKDITEFTKLEATIQDEDAENDFMELTEYLRAAVIFLHTELNSADCRTVH
jgi:uncharacterized protein